MMTRVPAVVLPGLHRFGWAGLGLWLVAAVLAAIGFYDHVEARRQATRSPDDLTPAYLAREREIKALLQHIPPARERESLVAALLEVASSSGLEVSGGRYREEAFEGGLLRRIETTLPVTGERLAVLRWGDGVAVSLPAAALTRISLNRADVKDPFSGDIRLDLLLRGSP